MLIRSFLFTPAHRLDLSAKAARAGADAIVLDLEDGTPAARRPEARRSLSEAVTQARRGGHAKVFVRVNAVAGRDFAADAEAVLAAGVDGVVAPKVGAAADVASVRSALGVRSVVVGIETIAGVFEAQSIAAAPGVSALYFGAEDLAAQLGARRTEKGDEVLYARAKCVLAARAAGVPAIDQAVVEVRDEARFSADATTGRDFGYTGKICLLPRQVELANAIFSPSAEEIARAERLIAAFDDGVACGEGVIEFEGMMVDEPVVRHARSLLALSHQIAAG